MAPGTHRNLRLKEHEVVAMDQLVAAAPAEEGLDLLRPPPGEAAGLGGAVGDEALGDRSAVRGADQDGVAAAELSLDQGDAGGQQGRAALEGAERAGVDREGTRGREAGGDPVLAGAPRGEAYWEQGGAGAGRDGGERTVHVALGKHD